MTVRMYLHVPVHGFVHACVHMGALLVVAGVAVHIFPLSQGPTFLKSI